MKNLKVILLVAVIALISSCKNAGTTATTNSTNNTSNSTTTNIAPKGSIVYIQMDSLVNKYDMFNDLKTELESKAQAIEDDLKKKGRSFESAAKDFETKINKGLLTRAQAEEQQQILVQRQQNLQQLTQQKQIEMAEEEAVMGRKVMDAVKTFLEKYNQEKGYALILTTSGATNAVIVGDPSLDITNDVLTGLNNEYVNSKK
jgi:Outer membrane protein